MYEKPEKRERSDSELLKFAEKMQNSPNFAIENEKCSCPHMITHYDKEEQEKAMKSSKASKKVKK